MNRGCPATGGMRRWTVEANIGLASKVLGWDACGISKRARELLDVVALAAGGSIFVIDELASGILASGSSAAVKPVSGITEPPPHTVRNNDMFCTSWFFHQWPDVFGPALLQHIVLTVIAVATCVILAFGAAMRPVNSSCPERAELPGKYHSSRGRQSRHFGAPYGPSRAGRPDIRCSPTCFDRAKLDWCGGSKRWIRGRSSPAWVLKRWQRSLSLCFRQAPYLALPCQPSRCGCCFDPFRCGVHDPFLRRGRRHESKNATVNTLDLNVSSLYEHRELLLVGRCRPA